MSGLVKKLPGLKMGPTLALRVCPSKGKRVTRLLYLPSHRCVNSQSCVTICQYFLFFLLQGTLTLEKVAQFFEEKVQYYMDKSDKRAYANLENILSSICGYNCWRRDPNFNVRNHIEQLDINVTYTKEKLENYFSENSASHNAFPDSKPQWQITIVPKYDGKVKFSKCLNIYFNILQPN